AAGFLGGIASGASLKGALKGALFAGLTAGVANWVGHGAGGLSPFGGASWLAHGITQGAIAELRGGKFKHGFISAVAGHVSGMVTRGIGGIRAGAIAARTAVASVFGGLATKATGGSFHDGAMNAALVHLFNNEMRDYAIREAIKESEAIEKMSPEQLKQWKIDQLPKFELSAGMTAQGTLIEVGGGMLGLNVQAFSKSGNINPYTVQGLGIGKDKGVSLEGNLAIYVLPDGLGEQNWAGDFPTANFGFGMFSVSYFQGSGWYGIGLGIQDPGVDASITNETYTPMRW
ncbi:hypothetical protein, partial [Leucothrix pacifica]